MARLARLYAPNTPQLILVRFHRSLGSPLEPAPSEKLNLLADWLRDAAREEKVSVHGWVLLNDRLVLLCTPPSITGTARLVQAVGRRYATRIHRGRAFAERYRCALLQPDAWVLKGLIWLEHLPVQLKYVDESVRWPWSSAAQHTGQGPAALRWTTEHTDYWRLGNTPFERQAHYRRLLEQGPSETQSQALEKALFGQWALGDEDFLTRINHLSSRRLAPAKRGRPKNSAKLIKPDAEQQESVD